MSLSDVYQFSDKKSLPAGRDLDRLEARIGSPLPMGYREYMSVLGAGWYCDLLNVSTPEQVWLNTPQQREELASCFEDLGPENHAILDPVEAARGFPFGYCEDGYCATLWHVPGARYPIYVLMPGHDQILWAENGFHEPLRWTGLSGPFEETHSLRPCFRSLIDRRTVYVEHKMAIPFSRVRSRLEQLLPGCVSVAERTDDTGRYFEWHAWNRSIGGRVSILSDFVTGEAGWPARVDEAVARIDSSQAISGVDVCIEFDRDASQTIDGVTKTLSAEGFRVRLKRGW